MTVLGSGFTKVKSVKFGATAGTRVKVVSSGKLTVTVPPHGAGTVDVRVAAAAGTSVVSAHDKYTYDVRPAVSSVSPKTGTTAGGTTVTVRGTGFTGVRSVLFGSGAGAKVKVVSGTELTVASPAHTVGIVDIRVVTPGGTSAAAAADRYAYVAPLAPVTGLKATAITASGVTLSWSNPASSGFAGVMIRRTQGAVPPASTTAGTLVANTSPTATTYTNGGLAPGTEYSYALFADDSSKYSAVATITVTTGRPPARDVSGTLTKNTTWSPAGASAYILQGNVDIPSGITLTIEPGTIIKAASGAQFTAEGTLDAAGANGNPVTFTSANDNSIGGKTGSGLPKAGDWGGIWVDNGSVDVEHATVAYASRAVAGSSGTGSVVVKDSVISGVSTGLTDDQPFSVYSSGVFGTFTAIDDSITSSAAGIDVTSANATVTGNVIVSGAGSTEGGLVVVAAGVTTVTPPVVADNTVTAPAGRPDYEVSSPALDFAQLASNSAGSSADPAFVVSGTVAASQTMPAAPYPWLLTVISQSGGVSAVGLDVAAGATLTVAPGTVVKGLGDNEYFLARLTVEGTLDAVGTSAAPIVFTSANDSLVGGGTGTGSPAAGDWSGIQVDGGGIDMENAKLEYAFTAVSLSGTSGLLASDTISDSAQAVAVTAGSLSLRGTLSGDGYGVSACDWGNGCSVDAAYVDWGDAGRWPFPFRAAAAGVRCRHRDPWTGEDPSASPDLWAVANCDGRYSPPQNLATAQDNFNQTIAGLQIDCSGDMQTACQQIQTDEACYSSLEDVAWSNVSIAGIPATPPDNGDVAGVFVSWMETAEKPVVSTLASAADFGRNIYQAVDLYDQLTDAYNTCTQ